MRYPEHQQWDAFRRRLRRLLNNRGDPLVYNMSFCICLFLLYLSRLWSRRFARRV
jgi:hypothetical protein